MSSAPLNTKVTPAFYLQSLIAFGVASAGLCGGVALLPIDPWMRAFIGMGVLFVITSTFNLAKCVRDRQEEALMAAWAEQAQAYGAGSHHAYAGKSG
ncbi:hypothetical protein J0910_15900 [Nocardiopsis sp. CNT-189]|uniref:YiaA/YiaB family inner membrane protein n=1 Tax=Nocardiopsis oceanisediminis TaxID=2816862 RepID=UPI003B31C1D2